MKTKKIVSALLAAGMLAGYTFAPELSGNIFTVTASADDVSVEGDYPYTVSNGKATVVGYNGAGGDIVIPSELGGYPVTSIGRIYGNGSDAAIAFSCNDSITSIKIPEGVTFISGGTFCYCNNLVSVVLPDSLLSMNGDVFKSCTSLTDITIPINCTSFGGYVFADCTSLKEIKVAEGNNRFTVEDGILYNADKSSIICYPAGKDDITAFTIPDSVTEIYNGAFCGCEHLKSITIPNTIKNIHSFWDCVNLTEVNLPSSAKILERSTFSGCTALKSIVIPEGVICIGESCFFGCKSLSDIFIPSSVKIIDDGYRGNCFTECSSDLTIHGINGSCAEKYAKKYNISFIGKDEPVITDPTPAVPVPDPVLGYALKDFFPDEIFREYVSENFDKDKNGYISEEEAENVTRIYLWRYGLTKEKYSSDLKGVEIFKNLETLSCYGQALTSLDVSMNSKLRQLDCSSNFLTELDISQNTSLEELNFYNNYLSEIDLSNNAELKSLSLEANSRLDVLDVSNNPKLEKLVCNMVKTIYGIAGSYAEEYADKNGIAFVAVDAAPTQINGNNFPDPVFRAYIAENFDKDNDGILSDEEIAAVKAITVHTENVSSLKGIEFFTELESLFCYGPALEPNQSSAKGQLTELDISKNKKLMSLNCFGNHLTKLDVSQNAALVELSCHVNMLTELDVSKNTALVSLCCGINPITELDVSKNTALASLACWENKLTTLDISNNPELTQLWCRGNLELKKLDVSKNPKLSELLIGTETTVYGISGTYPETYAKENGIKFIDINAPEPPVTGTVTVSGDDGAGGAVIEIVGADGKKYDVDVSGDTFSVSSLPDGVYTLTVRKSKYCPRDCAVTVADGQMTGELDVKLQKYGDIDGTGEINITDALQIVNYRNSKASSFDKMSGGDLAYLVKLADINGDGQVNITDALQIVNFRNGKKSAFDDIA